MDQVKKDETRNEDNSIIENEKKLIEAKTKQDHGAIVEDIVEEEKVPDGS